MKDGARMNDGYKQNYYSGLLFFFAFIRYNLRVPSRNTLFLYFLQFLELAHSTGIVEEADYFSGYLRVGRWTHSRSAPLVGSSSGS